MKKRILAFTLIFAMLFSMAIIPTVADATPNVLCTPAGKEALPTQNALRALSESKMTAELFAEYKGNVISTGLSASKVIGPNAGKSGNGGGDMVNPSLTTLEQYQAVWSDIANGFSMIGATDVCSTEKANDKGSLNRVVDGTWKNSVWNTAKVKVDLTARYNVNGVKYTNQVEDKDDYRYIAMWTFNFGKVKEIEAFSYLVSGVNAMPQSADIYVSNDGVNWTLVDYYDRVEGRIGLPSTNDANSADFGYVNTASGKTYAWADSTGSYVARWYIFNLTEVQQAQYLRIAATTWIGNNDGAAGAGQCTDIKAMTDPDAKKEAAYTVGKGIIDGQMQIYEMMVHGDDVAVETVGAQCSKLDGENNTYDVRFVTKVNQSVVGAALVKQINYKVSAVYEQGDVATDNTVAEKVFSVNSVYKTIETAEGTYSVDGSYLALFKITGIPQDVKVTFTITPEIEYANGVKVTGAPVEYTPNGAYTPDVTD